jgi:hypothetical protein
MKIFAISQTQMVDEFDMNNNAFSANATAKIKSAAPRALNHFKEVGYRFDAGQ